MKFSSIDKTVGKSMIAVEKSMIAVGKSMIAVGKSMIAVGISMIFCDEPFSKYNN